MIGGALRMPGGDGYGRMPVMTDMSNRPANTTAWQRGSMSAVLKIAVMIFVSLLSMVALIGAFGLISGPSMKLESETVNGKNTLSENRWLFNWDTNNDPGIGLLYFDEQAYLDRPSIPLRRSKPAKNREEDIYEGLARSQIDQLASLRARNLTFIINVIGWKRRASLKRLVNSLEKANYLGFTTRLHFHLDGDAHPLVKEFVEEYEWPHGKTMMNIHTERLGLEATIVNSWDARRDDQFAFFFEDDIEASPHYFEYTMLVLQKYIFPDPAGPRSTSYLASKMIGIALNTPRFNEIVFPPYRWVPQHVIGQKDYQFAFQLPNSWGCLYFPWTWREYREYHAWRRAAEIPTYAKIVPDSFINNWLRSWKKSLIELAYMRGYFMIYPNLPGQHGFSIHHRERGEHTTGSGEDPLVDQIGDVYLDYFTIPLVSDMKAINRLYATMRPLQDLPVVNFHHEKVKDIHSLVMDGHEAIKALQPFGFDFEKFNPNPGCILDNFSPAILESEPGPKYLLYEGQGSAFDQLLALRDAFAYAKALDRILIIPPVTFERRADKKFQVLTLDWLIDLSELRKDSWASSLLLSELGTEMPWIDRIVEFRRKPKSATYSDTVLSSSGIVPIHDVLLAEAPINDQMIHEQFSRCHDKFLSFRSLVTNFRGHLDKETEKKFLRWSAEKLAMKKRLLDVYKIVTKPFNLTAGPVGCLVFTKGDNPSGCGRGIQFETEDQGKLVNFRSCNATVSRSLEYLAEAATKQNIQLSSIYLFTDDATPSVAIPRSIEQTKGSGKEIQVYRSSMLAETLQRQGVLHYDIRDLADGIQMIFEHHLCVNADVFLGNVFSSFAVRVAKYRDALGKPYNILGYDTADIFSIKL